MSFEQRQRALEQQGNSTITLVVFGVAAGVAAGAAVACLAISVVAWFLTGFSNPLAAVLAGLLLLPGAAAVVAYAYFQWRYGPRS